MRSAYLRYFQYALILVAFFGALHAHASIIDGTISATNHSAQVCENSACTATSTSGVNFGYFSTALSYNIRVVDSQLSGYFWGSSFGYVAVNCASVQGGCSSANGNFKVSNDNNGHLSGWAWGDTAGWVNFGPFSNSATSTVSINTSGEFSGYAWSQNFGWIKFDCGNAGSCVQTDWRPQNSRPQCSDGIDNDGDLLIDSADAGCHTDGYVGNSASYDPTINQEYTQSGRPRVPSVIPTTSTTPPVSTNPNTTPSTSVIPTSPTSPTYPSNSSTSPKPTTGGSKVNSGNTSNEYQFPDDTNANPFTPQQPVYPGPTDSGSSKQYLKPFLQTLVDYVKLIPAAKNGTPSAASTKSTQKSAQPTISKKIPSPLTIWKTIELGASKVGEFAQSFFSSLFHK